MTKTETEGRTHRTAASEFQVAVAQTQDFEFQVTFDKPQYPQLLLDAPAPVGKDEVPSPSRILAAAIGHCLSSGLLYCARKAHVPLGPIQATVRTEIVRDERGYPRIGAVAVEIDPHVDEHERERAARCVEMFQDVCMVSESVREGIEISVRVKGFCEAPGETAV